MQEKNMGHICPIGLPELSENNRPFIQETLKINRNRCCKLLWIDFIYRFCTTRYATLAIELSQYQFKHSSIFFLKI